MPSTTSSSESISQAEAHHTPLQPDDPRRPPAQPFTLGTKTDRRFRQWRWARRTAVVGGLLLASTFFLPAINCCSSVIVPSEVFWESALDIAGGGPSGIADSAVLIVESAAPYAFGLLVALCGAVPLFRGFPKRGQPEFFLPVVAYGFVVAAVTALADWLCFFSPSASKQVYSWSLNLDVWTHWAWIWMTVSVAHFAGSRLASRAKNLCTLWGASASLLIWFSSLILTTEAVYYGGWLSLAGSVLLFGGLTVEGKLLHRNSLGAAIVALLLGRVSSDRLDDSCCGCGYLLVGLTSSRCPECGQPFELRDPTPQ